MARQLACFAEDTLKIKELVWLPECNANTNTRLENLGGVGFSEVLTGGRIFGSASGLCSDLSSSWMDRENGERSHSRTFVACRILRTTRVLATHKRHSSPIFRRISLLRATRSGSSNAVAERGLGRSTVNIPATVAEGLPPSTIIRSANVKHSLML